MMNSRGYRVGDLHPTHDKGGIYYDETRSRQSSIPPVSDSGQPTGVVRTGDGGRQGVRDGADSSREGEDESPSSSGT